MRVLRVFAASSAALAAAAAMAAAAGAQNLSTTLTVTGFPVVVSSPGGADFLNGFIQTSPVSYQVAATTGPASQSRSATVSISCTLPCPLSGAMSLASLSWRRGDQPGWTPLTTSAAVVEQRSMVRGGMNDPWGNTLLFRFLLDWEADTPGTAAAFAVMLTLTVTAP